MLGDNSTGAQRKFEKLPKEQKRPAAPSVPPKRGKPVQQPRPAPAAAQLPSQDDEPVLVGKMDESGVNARFQISDQEVAAMASRAYDRVRDAGFDPPKMWRDNPDAFKGSLANDALAGEAGHYVHRHAVGLDRYLMIRNERFTPAESKLVTEHVSK